MDLSTLKDLLPVMRDCKVASLKLEGLEIVFFPASPAPRELAAELLNVAAELSKTDTKPPSPDAPLKPIETIKVDDVVVPQRLEDEMSYDRIRDWSVPSDQSVPLTDDQPFGELAQAVPDPILTAEKSNV